MELTEAGLVSLTLVDLDEVGADRQAEAAPARVLPEMIDPLTCAPAPISPCRDLIALVLSGSASLRLRFGGLMSAN